MPRWVDAAASAQDDTSSEEGSDAEEVDGAATTTATVAPPARPTGKISISLKPGQQVCHVCGQSGHTAGFVGARYLDCINKPCYLCKQPGHTTATCPHKTAPETGCTAAANVAHNSLLAAVRGREASGSRCRLALGFAPHRVDAAVLKLHSRRCTCLEFHPTLDNIVISGDKKGQVAVWDFERVVERTVYSTLHSCLNNAMRFLPHHGDGMSVATASSDGTCKLVDIETGCAETLCNLNPGGWIHGESNEKTWGMFYGLDAVGPSAVAAGDSRGWLYMLDPRSKATSARVQLHKKGCKVTSLHSHPHDPNLLLSSGGDHTIRLTDLRQLSHAAASSSSGKPAAASARGAGGTGGPWEVACVPHGRAVNSAYFSPLSGARVLTTCQDNRLRIWDSLYGLGGPPDREIVHSHDFNRYLTPFRAEWDPKDPLERVLVVGRYISEDMGGVALHPVDVLDASTGRLLAELCDPNLTTICPVNKPHPRLDVIVSGSSRSLYAWRKAEEDDDGDERLSGVRRGGAAGSSGQPAGLRGSNNFVFFDADDDLKKRQRGANAGAAAGVGDGSGDDDDDGSPVGGKKRRGRPPKVVAETAGSKKRGKKGA